ncbi:hypothetical protein PIB30_085339, partial [Stylosanthes scabra]|nr:hypothetical protein [Stylosanthes scabra]
CELTRRLSSRNSTTTWNESKYGFLRANIATTLKRPVLSFWVFSVLPLRILKDGEDAVTLASVSEAIVEEVASLVVYVRALGIEKCMGNAKEGIGRKGFMKGSKKGGFWILQVADATS